MNPDPRAIPKAFNPTGWDAVRAETVKKEEKLRHTSGANYFKLLESHGTTNNTPSGWAWFTKTGFCDANDTQRIIKKNFPQRPFFYTKHPAGHDDIDTRTRGLREKVEAEGRGSFLDRTDPMDLARLSRTSPNMFRNMSGTSFEPSKSIRWISNEGSYPGAVTPGDVSHRSMSLEEQATMSPYSSRLASGTTPRPLVAGVRSEHTSVMAAEMNGIMTRKQMARSLSDTGPKWRFGGEIFGPAEPKLSGMAPYRDGKGLLPFNRTRG